MSIVDKICAAGIVGCGGAGFPTHAKLKGKIEYLIINGAECEPLLRTDRYIMCNEAPSLVKALVAMKEELAKCGVEVEVKENEISICVKPIFVQLSILDIDGIIVGVPINYYRNSSTWG